MRCGPFFGPLTDRAGRDGGGHGASGKNTPAPNLAATRGLATAASPPGFAALVSILAANISKNRYPAFMTSLLSPKPEAPKLTFTLNEVVVRLLGWTPQDFRYGKNISSNLGSAGTARIDLEEPYIDVLNDRFREARGVLHLVPIIVKTPDAIRAIKAIKEIIRVHVSEIELAKDYEFDILQELEKGAESQLKVDFQATRDRGQICLHRRGIVRWVQENYEKDFFPATEGRTLAKVCGLQSKKRTIDYDGAEYPIDEPDAKGGLTPTSTQSLYITFASLIEFVVAKCGQPYGEAGVPNVTNLAVELSKRAHLPSKRTPLVGQKPERIKDRIEEAMRVKSVRWKAKPKPKPKR